MTVEYVWLVCDELPTEVLLTDPGPRAIDVVKVISRRTGRSLWQSRVLIGRLPATVLEGVAADVAQAVADELRGAGAQVEVRA
ncbi:ribosomal protein L7/L12 [Kitasatospora sp. NPDC088346]|uniref:ribosomal protein L7/L12 n=1 Tax=Kitasatospora sp. NPDC088346 TaxID=3364073 RepID=UPI00381601FA